MEFFNSAIEVLQTLVVALGAGLGVWGAIKDVYKRQIIESPSLYLDMTAYENLEVQRLQRGIPGKGCIDNALALSLIHI